MGTSAAAGPAGGVRRLNVKLPAQTYNELQSLAQSSGSTMTDVLRTALGLVKIAYDEQAQQHVLAVATPDGKLLKQIVLPK
jgi:hypothetical protein